MIRCRPSPSPLSRCGPDGTVAGCNHDHAMQSCLHNFEATIDFRLHDQGKAIAESMRRDLAMDFQRHLDRVGLYFQKEINKVQQVQQDLSGPLASGAAQSRPAAPSVVTTDNGTSNSDSSLPAPEIYLPLATLLAALSWFTVIILHYVVLCGEMGKIWQILLKE